MIYLSIAIHYFHMSEIELISLSSAWTVSDPGYSGFRTIMIDLNIKINLQTFEDILKLNMASN